MVRQWGSSGLSVREFCTDHDISEQSFYAWRRTIAQADAQSARFVPVQVVPDEEAAGNAPGQGLELLLGGSRVLRVGPGFDEATLRRLLALLEEGRP